MFSMLEGGFSTIVADPPWTFKAYSEKGYKKSAQLHYECMSIKDICNLPVHSLSNKDCILFLWTCAPMLDIAFQVLDAWKFKYKSRMSWIKTTKNNKIRIGPGYIVRTMHEDILIGTRGNPKLAKAFPSIFHGLAREHSRKPEEFYSLVNERCSGPYLHMFSSQKRIGTQSWGNQTDKFPIEKTINILFKE